MYQNFAHCDAYQFLISFGALERFETVTARRHPQYPHYNCAHLVVDANLNSDFHQR